MNGMNRQNVLAIAAHPDDEVLGCGGTLALHVDNGDSVTAVIVCEWESPRYGEGGVSQESHIRCAAEKLGVSDVRLLRFPDQRLDTMTLIDIISPLEKIVAEVKPRTVYCQYGGDVNRDHELLFKAAMVATRPTEDFIGAVYAFDTASSTEWAYPRSFVPDTWTDISSTLERKLEAMACYVGEVRAFPHPRSLDALRHKAASLGSQCCLAAAEVFMTVRKIARNGKTPA
jgi:N-acetylglucosamine malate deacetylase 1